MAEKLTAVKGMNDLLPEEAAKWEWLESRIRDLLARWGYRNMRTPIVEQTPLFVRGIGEVTDIVEKEMFSWTDAMNGDRLTLRPEATAGMVRAVIEHNVLYNGPLRVWQMGPMYRHERPQKGRQREFNQLDVEAFGYPGPDVDAELILMVRALWRELGLAEGRHVALEINCLGQPEERGAHRAALITYFEAHVELLDAEARRRLHSNPLRILDTKNPEMEELVRAAPVLFDHLDAESRDHFGRLCGFLDQAGVSYTLNPRLVRGLDYYTRTVFEWTTSMLGAQGTVCAGGRYDGLVEQLGGQPTPAAGFALGMERLVELARQQGVDDVESAPQVCMIVAADGADQMALTLGESLRRVGIRVLGNTGGSIKAQLRRADRSGAEFALLFGEQECASGTVSLKPLRSGEGQATLTPPQAVEVLRQRLGQAT